LSVPPETRLNETSGIIIENKIDDVMKIKVIQNSSIDVSYDIVGKYKHVPIVYWVSDEWESEEKEAVFVTKIEEYKLGRKHRKLAFLGLK